jgi:hypothetical protein
MMILALSVGLGLAASIAAILVHRVLRPLMRKQRLLFYAGWVVIGEVFLFTWLALAIQVTPPAPVGVPDVRAMLGDPMGFGFWFVCGGLGGWLLARIAAWMNSIVKAE